MSTFEVKTKKSFQDCSRDDCDSCPGNVPITEDGDCPDEFMCDDNDDCYR